MIIYLVQHGNALPKATDTDRPLSKQGREDMARMATYLKKHVKPVQLLHSGKTRAKQSADILAAILAPSVSPQAIDGIGPNDSVEVFAKALENTAQNLLLVGHLPFLPKLAAFLTTHSTHEILEFQPGSVVCLTRQENRRWLIQWMLRPELL